MMAIHSTPPKAAFIPVIDHMRTNASGNDPTVAVFQDAKDGVDQSSVPMKAKVEVAKGIRRGEELRIEFETNTSANLLAKYGFVPVPPDQEEDVYQNAMDETFQTIAANVGNSMELDVTVESKMFGKEGTVQDGTAKMKLEFLAERGWDLRPGYAPRPPVLEMPASSFTWGMLMPLARFLAAPALPTRGAQRDIQASFEHFFYAVYRGRPQEPYTEESILTEVDACDIAATWCESLLKKYQPVVDKITARIDSAFAVLNKEDGWQVGNMVLAHYKAKGADGKIARSRKAQEATIMNVSNDEIAVKFLTNGVRQKVPASWVSQMSDISTETQAMSQEEAYLCLLRAYLARDVLMAEVALAEVQFDLSRAVGESGLQFLDAIRNKNFSAARKAKQDFEERVRTDLLEMSVCQKSPLAHRRLTCNLQRPMRNPSDGRLGSVAIAD